jgi:hypothetical protein
MCEQALYLSYIGTLPGKFSCFPTVTSQTDLRLKAQLHFDDTANSRPARPDPKSVQLAHILVADPYPLQILTGERNREAEFSPRGCFW